MLCSARCPGISTPSDQAQLVSFAARESARACASPLRDGLVFPWNKQIRSKSERKHETTKASPLGGVRAGCSQSVAQVERMQAQHRIACSPSQLQPWLPSLVFFRATCGCGPGQKGQCRVDTNEGLPTQNVFRRTVSVLVPILVSFFSGVCPTEFKTMMMIETTSFGQQLGIKKPLPLDMPAPPHSEAAWPTLGAPAGRSMAAPGTAAPGPGGGDNVGWSLEKLLGDPAGSFVSCFSCSCNPGCCATKKGKRRQQRARSLRVARTHVRCECTLSHSSYSNRNDNVSTGE